jgi:hypothetical protein
VDNTTGRAPAPRPFEGRLRRGLELFFLGITLFAGVVVVGGCGVASLVGLGEEAGLPITLALLAGGVIVVGLVYLATSMSRDVRMLKAKLLEEERRNGRV